MAHSCFLSTNRSGEWFLQEELCGRQQFGGKEALNGYLVLGVGELEGHWSAA